MHHSESEASAHLAQIDKLLNQIAARPDVLALHQQLRAAALRYKTAGGNAGGLLQTLTPPPKDPLERAVHIERRWSLDPGNVDLLIALINAISSIKSPDMTAVATWLQSLLQRAQQ